jgi:non-ribosomal peptide synthetase component E (peptide arylation enzyme)
MASTSGTVASSGGGGGLRRDESVTGADVEAFCDGHPGLAGYGKPRRVALVDSFPRTWSQKVHKAALTAELEWG